MSFYNTYDFDLTANYQALLACILNPDITSEKALAVVASVYTKSEKKVSSKYSNKARKIVVTDTENDEVIEFKSISKATKFLKVNYYKITECIESKDLYKNRYKIDYTEGNEKHE